MILDIEPYLSGSTIRGRVFFQFHHYSIVTLSSIIPMPFLLPKESCFSIFSL